MPDGVMSPVIGKNLEAARERARQQEQRLEDQVREQQAAAAERLHEWTQTSVRFVLGGNAGGAVAVLSFVAAAKPSFAAHVSAVSALAIFLTGLFCAGLSAIGFWARAASNGPPGADAGVVQTLPQRAREELFARAGTLALTSFCAFALGALFGIAAVGLVRFPSPLPLDV